MRFNPGELIVRDDTRHPQGTPMVANHGEIWAGQLLDQTDGGEVKVYATGAGTWMWDIVEGGGGVWD